MTNDWRSGASNLADAGRDVEMEVVAVPDAYRRRRDPASSRRRRRLVGVVVTGLAIVATVVLATASPFDHPARSTSPSQHPRHEPSPTDPVVTSRQALDALPQGLPPKIPYLQDGDLHLDGAVVPTRADRLLTAGSTLLVGRSDVDPVRWWIVDGLDLVHLPELDGVFTPSLSPTGDLLVWTSYPDKETTRITAWQPSTRAELDHVDLDAPYAECCGGGQEGEIYGIDLQDAVYWASRHGYQVWRPTTGANPRRLSGIRAMLEIAPTGPVRQGGALGRTDARGRWSKLLDLPMDQGMTWSEDGKLVAYGGDDAGTAALKQSPTAEWVLDTTSGTRTRLDLPSGVAVAVVAFESDRTVLVDAIARPRRHYLLRCTMADGTCERTLEPGRPTWILAEHSYF